VDAASDRLEILVNNPGVAQARHDGFLSFGDENWQRTFASDASLAWP
jgi:NAD(P)-dependent dehydrogenase (short-subunit alcohol dehydrogenase family)